MQMLYVHLNQNRTVEPGPIAGMSPTCRGGRGRSCASLHSEALAETGLALPSGDRSRGEEEEYYVK